jgi:hypothetical protein
MIETFVELARDYPKILTTAIVICPMIAFAVVAVADLIINDLEFWEED